MCGCVTRTFSALASRSDIWWSYVWCGPLPSSPRVRKCPRHLVAACMSFLSCREGNRESSRAFFLENSVSMQDKGKCVSQMWTPEQRQVWELVTSLGASHLLTDHGDLGWAWLCRIRGCCEDLAFPSSHSTPHPFTKQPFNGREVQRSRTSHLSQSGLNFLCSILRPLRKSLEAGNSPWSTGVGESEVAHSSAVRATECRDGHFRVVKNLFTPFSGAHRHTGTSFTFKACFIVRHLMGRFHFYYLIWGPKALGCCQMPKVGGRDQHGWQHPGPLHTLHMTPAAPRDCLILLQILKQCSCSRREGIEQNFFKKKAFHLKQSKKGISWNPQKMRRGGVHLASF